MSEDEQQKQREDNLAAINANWKYLTYWQRKKLYFMFVWFMTKKKITKLFHLWTLPNFAIRQIRMTQHSPHTANDEAKDQTESVTESEVEWSEFYKVSTHAEKLELLMLLQAIIEARKGKQHE